MAEKLLDFCSKDDRHRSSGCPRPIVHVLPITHRRNANECCHFKVLSFSMIFFNVSSVCSAVSKWDCSHLLRVAFDIRTYQSWRKTPQGYQSSALWRWRQRYGRWRRIRFHMSIARVSWSGWVSYESRLGTKHIGYTIHPRRLSVFVHSLVGCRVAGWSPVSVKLRLCMIEYGELLLWGSLKISRLDT